MEFNDFLAQEQPRLEEALRQAVSHRGHYEARVWEAMEYSLMAGGKRIRPLMLELAAWAASGRPEAMEEVRPFAVALEMIHTYSLIHDDLPAMDNDDYRRGRLTNHRVYGEGMAVLAGDGLLNLAYETMLDAVVQDPRPGRIQAAATIAHAAGPLGMVAGQTADILAEEGQVTEEHLEYIEKNKTGQLITAALAAGVQAAGGGQEQAQAVCEAGMAFGRAFQIQDDLLDIEGDPAVLGKATGHDAENEKVTFVTLYGTEEARRQVKELSVKAEEALRGFENPAGELLRYWIRELIYRKK